MFNLPELDVASHTSQMLGHQASSSTIEEDDEDSERAAYTRIKELGRLSTQVGQRLLDTTRRDKTLVSFHQTYHILHTLIRPFLFSSSSS